MQFQKKIPSTLVGDAEEGEDGEELAQRDGQAAALHHLPPATQLRTELLADSHHLRSA